MSLGLPPVEMTFWVPIPLARSKRLAVSQKELVLGWKVFLRKELRLGWKVVLEKELVPGWKVVLVKDLGLC